MLILISRAFGLLKWNSKIIIFILLNRDDPKSPPVFVASNQAEKNCEFTVLGENLFAAVK